MCKLWIALIEIRDSSPHDLIWLIYNYFDGTSGLRSSIIGQPDVRLNKKGPEGENIGLPSIMMELFDGDVDNDW